MDSLCHEKVGIRKAMSMNTVVTEERAESMENNYSLIVLS